MADCEWWIDANCFAFPATSSRRKVCEPSCIHLTIAYFSPSKSMFFLASNCAMLTYRIMCETETQTHCPVSWAPAALSTRDLKWKQRVVSSQTRAPHWSWALKRKLPVFMRKAGPRWCGSEWRLKVLSWKEDYKLAEMYGLTEAREAQKTAHLSSNSLDCRARELWDNSVYIYKKVPFHWASCYLSEWIPSPDRKVMKGSQPDTWLL